MNDTSQKNPSFADGPSAEILDADAVGRALTRMAHEIVEKNKGCGGLCLIGVRRRGVPLAQMLAARLLSLEGQAVPVGEMDITFYRDDLRPSFDAPVVGSVRLPFSVTGQTVVLVDDVLYTGRTARAAIDAVFSAGRPSAVRLAILVDRGHRELPIRADYVGRNVPTSRQERVDVHVPPFEPECGVYLLKPSV